MAALPKLMAAFSCKLRLTRTPPISGVAAASQTRTMYGASVAGLACRQETMVVC